MKRCGSCAWWDEDDGACHAIQSRDRHHPNLVARDGAVMEYSLDDDSGFDVRLITKRDFGCTLHENIR